ncbi:hypothetical protein [Salinicola sp. DM10]|uniref:hypothetical protein n=1 Tax=Salinicola sp. DM10 TaxID=2815721 RepID=UPI001A8DB1F3|nr:hypothetical protein [Salinicola sp. DM10]MCE3025768.1 hypothetical protein [Salinicola sp. DM10]
MRKNLSLFELRLFWISLLIPLAASLLMAGYIGSTSTLYYSAGFEWINEMASVFRVPLAIAALMFPAVALVASAHRSEQTKRQITAMEANNTFSNFYKHKEEFGKLCRSLEREFQLAPIEDGILYGKIFEHNSPESLSYRMPYSSMSEINPVWGAFDAISKIQDLTRESCIDVSKLEEAVLDLVIASKRLSFIPLSSKVMIQPYKRVSLRVAIFFDPDKPYLHVDKLERFLIHLDSFASFGQAPYGTHHMKKETYKAMAEAVIRLM